MASTERAMQAQASCQQLEMEHAQAMAALQVQYHSVEAQHCVACHMSSG